MHANWARNSSNSGGFAAAARLLVRARTAAKRINARSHASPAHPSSAEHPACHPAAQQQHAAGHTRARNARATPLRARRRQAQCSYARWRARCRRASRRAFRRARGPPAAKLAVEPVVAATDADVLGAVAPLELRPPPPPSPPTSRSRRRWPCAVKPAAELAGAVRSKKRRLACKHRRARRTLRVST